MSPAIAGAFPLALRWANGPRYYRPRVTHRQRINALRAERIWRRQAAAAYAERDAETERLLAAVGFSRKLSDRRWTCAALLQPKDRS